MKNSYLILLMVFAFLPVRQAAAQPNSQKDSLQLTGPQLLEKTIAYHDPNGKWSEFIGSFEITMDMPEAEKRVSSIDINLPAKSFELIVQRSNMISEYRVFKDSVTVAKMYLNKPDSTIATTDKDFERAVFMRDYYTYLYGLPMKLKDKGTVISYETKRDTLNDKEYLVLRADYEPTVGSDVWFFYIDPETFRMEAYQFFRQKQPRIKDPQTGEYILLSKEVEINGIKMPKIREWYYNKNDEYLATDTITN